MKGAMCIIAKLNPVEHSLKKAQAQAKISSCQLIISFAMTTEIIGLLGLTWINI
jgi:hypothetical protein